MATGVGTGRLVADRSAISVQHWARIGRPNGFRWVVTALLATMLAVAGALVPLRTGAPVSVRPALHPSVRATVRSGPQAVPAGLSQAIHARFGAGPIGLGAAPLVAGIAPAPGGWSVKAPSESLAGGISPTGEASVGIKGLQSASLKAISLNMGGTRSSLAVGSSSLAGGRLLQRLGAVKSTYAVTPGGLEQRFTIARPPTGGVKKLVLGLGSPQRWQVIRNGSGILATGAVYGQLAYAGLRTIDATGRVLSSHFVPGEAGPRIVVDSSGAAYPITIDPTWTTTSTPTATLTDGAAPELDDVGYSVALSSDGTTAVVGAAGNGVNGAGAYIYRASSEGSWSSTSTAVATLTGAPGDRLGSSVALSSDGTTALLGAYGANSFAGAAEIFHASSESSWATTSTPTATLTNSGGAANDDFGASVALSSDGTTAVVGAAGVNSQKGAVYVFHASSETSWSTTSTPTATLTNGGGSAGDSFGAVALSSDGTTALVSDSPQPGGSDVGAAYIFHVSSESSWSTTSTPTATLTVSGVSTFGGSVALSSDGTTALVGVPSSVSSGTGADSAYIFHASSESSWSTTSTPTAILTASGDSLGNSFGWSVALSSGGTTAIVGSWGQFQGSGAAYVFHVSSESSWSTTSTPTASLTSSGAPDPLGWSVALSSDGTTALVGAQTAGGGADPGSAEVFHASSESSWSTTSSPTATLTGSGAQDALGWSVALSSDGTTAVVGATAVEGDGFNGPGAVYIFHASSESSWSTTSTPTATLTNSGGSSADGFGSSVALSSDGTTALVGGNGAVYIFHASSESSWSSTSTPTATLDNSGGSAADGFGSSIALSPDGTTALVGATGGNLGKGAAAVFHASSESSWSTTSTPTAILTNGNGTANDALGFSVALSADGTTAAVGADGGNGAGAQYVLVFHASSEGSWTTTSAPAATLSNSSAGASDDFGFSVALSADGTTALVGATGANGAIGAAYVFHASSESSWSTTSTPNATLTNSAGAGGDFFGNSVALSSDGTTALVGAYGLNNTNVAGPGTAHIYQAPSESSWTTTSTPTATLTNGSTGQGFGDGVALSSDGTTALIGADQADTGSGAAYIFESTPPPPDGTGTMAVAPTSVTAGSTGNTLSFTYTAVAAGLSSGEIDVDVASGWSPPSTTGSSAGFTTSTCGTVGVSGTTIEVTGVTLAGGGTCTIAYGSKTSSGPGASAPSSPTTSTFTTLEKSTAGGTLTGLGTSPQVTVSPAQAAPAFTTDSPPLTATVGTQYSYTFVATGNPTPTYALGIGAPSWLSIGSTTGAVSGTPPTDTTSFTYSVIASNRVTPNATAGPFTVTVSPAQAAPAFTTDSPPLTATVGTQYSYTFVATGNPTPTYALGTGAPSWLSISSTSGALSGTPPTRTTSFTYSVIASNTVTPNATAGPFTVTVSPAPRRPGLHHRFAAADGHRRHPVLLHLRGDG